MVLSGDQFSSAAERFRGSTAALIYAHSFDAEILNAYYLRQRTEILSGYADVVDLLGGYPVFYNIDQFIALCSHADQLRHIDYVINVPGGSLELDLITIVATVAGALRKPVFPATGTAISLGQNKPIARRLARDLGWSVPRSVSFAEVGDFQGGII